MKRKLLAITIAVIITVGSIGAVAFASNKETEKDNLVVENKGFNGTNSKYESMMQMMESIGSEGMIEMHNSMSNMHGEERHCEGTKMNGS